MEEAAAQDSQHCYLLEEAGSSSEGAGLKVLEGSAAAAQEAMSPDNWEGAAGGWGRPGQQSLLAAAGQAALGRAFVAAEGDKEAGVAVVVLLGVESRDQLGVLVGHRL